MCRWNFSQRHQIYSNWGTGHKHASLTAPLQLRVQFSFLAQPHNHPSSVSSHLYACFLKVKYILCYLPYNYAKLFGGEWVLVWGFDFLELLPIPHPNLCPTAPKTHLKNPHIHWLRPFCWGAVSQWCPFFMLAVHQIKTETTEDECELMGTEVKCWKNEWCQHPALPP